MAYVEAVGPARGLLVLLPIQHPCVTSEVPSIAQSVISTLEIKVQEMETSLIVGIATGSVALLSLMVLSFVFLIRRNRRLKVDKNVSRTQVLFFPPKIQLSGSDDHLERQLDPPMQEVTTHRPRISHSPTMYSIEPGTRTCSMSTESPIMSPMSRYSTDATYTRNSLSRTSTMTNNNFQQYQAYSPHLVTPPISPLMPRLPASLKPGSRIMPSPNGWLPTSPAERSTHVRRMSYDYISSNLSPIQDPDSNYQMDSPSQPGPSVIKRRSTIDAVPYASYASLYSIAERPVVYTAKDRYYSAKNTTRETLVHIEGTQNALPELYGSEPVAGKRKHRSWGR